MTTYRGNCNFSYLVICQNEMWCHMSISSKRIFEMSFVHNSLIHIPLGCHYCFFYIPILLVLLYSKFRETDNASQSSIVSTSISYKYRGLAQCEVTRYCILTTTLHSTHSSVWTSDEQGLFRFPDFSWPEFTSLFLLTTISPLHWFGIFQDTTAEAFCLPLYAKWAQMNERLKRDSMCSRQPDRCTTVAPHSNISLAQHYLLSSCFSFQHEKIQMRLARVLSDRNIWASRSCEGKVKSDLRNGVASCTQCLQEKKARIKRIFI